MDTPITDGELLQIASDIAPRYYLKLGVELGHNLARLEQILQSKNNDYLRSNVAILMIWRDSPGQGESWRTKRSRLREIFSSVGIKTSDTVSSGNVTISMTGAPKNMVIGDQYHTYNHYHGFGGAGGAGGGGGGTGGGGAGRGGGTGGGGGAGGGVVGGAVGAGGAGGGGGGGTGRAGGGGAGAGGRGGRAGGGGAGGAGGGAGGGGGARGARGAGGAGAGGGGGAGGGAGGAAGGGGGGGVAAAGGAGGEAGAGAFQSSEPVASAAAQSVSIPEPAIGLSDAVLKEIAENLETDEQMESLARALGRTRTQINQCHASNRLTGSVTTRGTVEMLTSWKATVQPEIQMSRMRSAMTSARLLFLRETVLLKAEKQQEQEKQDYQRQLLVQQQQQQLQHPLQQHQQLEEHQSSHQAETYQEMISRVESPEGESPFSSLRSVDPRIAVSAGSLEEARGRIVESKQRSAPPCHPEPSTSSTSASYRRQQELCDIYLVYSQETEHVRKVKDIIRSNGWSMITKADRRLGVPKMASIEEALKTCSHVILVITEEDCDENDPHQTMTIEMAFQLKQALDGRVISIRCCEESSLPLSLRSLENVCINDVNLENELKNCIDVRRKRKEGGSLGISSTQMSTTYPRGEATASSATFDASNQSLIPSQVTSQVEPLISQISLTSSTHTSSSHPTGETMAPLGTSDTSSQCLTPSQVASQLEQLIPRISQLSTAPNSLLNIQGNVYNIGSIHFAGSPGAMPPGPTIVPPAVRHELSKRLNGTRVTHDDWRGLACAFKLDSYIDSLNNRPDPTGAVIGLAEGEKKLCSLDDLRGILVGMKRDDCVEVLDQHMGGAGELGNRLMITDRERDGSSSDEF